MDWPPVGQSQAGYLTSVDLNHPATVQQYPTALSVAEQVAARAVDLALQPGSTDTLAVTGEALNLVPVNIYERGVARYADSATMGAVDSLTGYYLAVGDASHLYITGGSSVSEVSLDPGGRQVAWKLPPMAYPLQFAGGKLFDGALVVDAAQQQLLGSIPQEIQAVPTVIAPDARHAYRAKFASASPAGKTRVQVQCFDLHTFAQSGSLTLDLPGAAKCAHRGAIRLGILGSTGLTFASDEALVIAPDVLNCVPGCSAGSAPPVYAAPTSADAKDAMGKVLA
ncbi:MAG: hypothetical protein JWN04_652 [Myxococcaceae bacterium]|nr:hypothetical protein [Myxococcaceae bacterium]